MRHRFRPWLKKLATPVTIMLVPHTRTGTINFKLPTAVLGLLLVMAAVGAVYVLSLTYHAVDYVVMKRKYNDMANQLRSVQGTIHSLRQAEAEFRRILSRGSGRQMLDAVAVDQGDGAIDTEALKRQIEDSMRSVAGIRQYLVQQRDLYRATPQGWPVEGRFSSGFGTREHPTYGGQRFHSGVDIAAERGAPVLATADGIVSVAGYAAGNGKVVVVEHGHGFSTVYAHNDQIVVRAGQTVKRGDQIAAAGATGTATGVHVHYEVWHRGRPVNPAPYAETTP